MIFGKIYGEVIEHLECPRCTAPANYRALKQDSLVVTRIVCEKCHYVKVSGIQTSDAFLDQQKIKKMTKKSKSPGSPTAIVRIKKNLVKLKERKSIHDLGL